MINMLLAETSGKSYAFTGEGAVMGSYGFLLGMVMVFAGIAIIVLIVSLIGSVFKKANASSKKVEEEVVYSAPQTSVQSCENELAPEIRAAIIAAISAVYFENKSDCEFIIRKIKRI